MQSLVSTSAKWRPSRGLDGRVCFIRARPLTPLQVGAIWDVASFCLKCLTSNAYHVRTSVLFDTFIILVASLQCNFDLERYSFLFRELYLCLEL